MTEELERKAEQFAEKHAFRVPYDGSNKFYDDVDFKASKEGYIAGVTELQEKMKKDLVSKLKELISYSTSPSCTKGMELFIKRIEDWEFVE